MYTSFSNSLIIHETKIRNSPHESRGNSHIKDTWVLAGELAGSTKSHTNCRAFYIICNNKYLPQHFAAYFYAVSVMFGPQCALPYLVILFLTVFKQVSLLSFEITHWLTLFLQRVLDNCIEQDGDPSSKDFKARYRNNALLLESFYIIHKCQYYPHLHKNSTFSRLVHHIIDVFVPHNSERDHREA